MADLGFVVAGGLGWDRGCNRKGTTNGDDYTLGPLAVGRASQATFMWCRAWLGTLRTPSS